MTRLAAPKPDLRDRILDAVERLLGRFGYQKLTVDDIAREARVARRTIYLRFLGKDHVVLASIDRVVERLLDRLRRLAAGDGPPAEKLRAMLLCRVLFRFDSVRGYRESLDELLGSLRPAYLVRRQRYFDAEAEVFATVLRELDTGTRPAGDHLETAHTLVLATNALLPSNLSARELGRRADVKVKAGRLANLLLAGLCRRRGT